MRPLAGTALQGARGAPVPEPAGRRTHESDGNFQARWGQGEPNFHAPSASPFARRLAWRRFRRIAALVFA